ncbi:hypothetical protein ACCT03_33640 [Rhizobium johnstonii]|uniref:hypothetical protein n=1 Tax=Rhizobium TaxID=379 RepID=UPI0010308D27|nr:MULTISPECIES: hypothetical protein [Rhizobium]TCA20342.1 hypothetical protein E0H70_32340 [Rhizobium leguminosarum bv. viciae]NEI05372.1 hypothetical protein [Rhizobium ruizarguesonis]NEI11086.1 hypothetical protein [Rhizobium ruizarguesonis]NEI59393.1 hypothetical protein [Rhizobium leguminosarum]NEI88233.1 hypothetical protein [Rhizobium leguminosarum]
MSGPNLTLQLRELLSDPVMLIFSTEKSTLWPSIGRGLGLRSFDDHTLDLFFSQSRYPDVLPEFPRKSRMAVTVTRLRDYRSYQFKGPALLMGLDPEDVSFVSDYRTKILHFFQAAGATPNAIDEWIGGESLLKARILVSEMYEQTPGLRAGKAVNQINDDYTF